MASGLFEEVYVSPKGQAWRALKVVQGDFAGIAFGNGRFVGGGDLISFSADGITWASVLSGPRAVDAVAFQDGQFVAVGRAGRIWTSADGAKVDWHWVPAANDLADVTWMADGSMLAVGLWGTMLKGLPGRCGGLFSDIFAQHPACQAVELLAGRKAIGGYPDGTFQPDRTATRAEFAKMIVSAMGRQPAPQGRLPFNDVAGHWTASSGYVQQAVALQAMSGFPDSSRPAERAGHQGAGDQDGSGSARAACRWHGLYSDMASSAWYAGWVRKQRRLH